MLEEFEKKIKIAQNFHSQNKFDSARIIYEEIIKNQPDNINVLFLIGTLEIQSKNYNSGIKYLLEGIKLNPKIPQFHNNLAVAYSELDLLKDALIAVENAITIKNNYFEAYNTKANIYLKYKNTKEAIKNYKKSISFNSNYVEAYNNLGNAYKVQKEFIKAEKCFKSALKINPNYVSALINLGINYKELNNNIEGLKTFQKIIKIKPDYSDAFINIAKIFMLEEDYDKAKINFEKGIYLDQNNASHHTDCGIFNLKYKKYSEAIAFFKKSISLNLNSFENFKNLAVCYFNQNKLKDAFYFFQKSLLINDKSPEVYNYIGYIYSNSNKFNEAKENFEKAINLDPQNAIYYLNLGNLLKENKYYVKAISNYKKAILLDKNLEFLAGILLNTKMMVCNWTNFDRDCENLIQNIKSKKKCIRPFASLSIFEDPIINKKVAEIFSNFYFESKNIKFKNSFRKKNKKIKVAYFSSDFKQNHPVSLLIEDLFKNYDKDNFEVYAFSLNATTNDDVFRKNLKSNIDYFYDIEDKSLEEVLKITNKINLDIAVDLNGHTKNSRTILFAYRLAPIQINFLGFPGTMGSNFYDYIIADKFVIPSSHENYFTEKILRMPNCYLINPSYRKVSKKSFSKEFFGIPDESFVYGCFNNNFKILPNIFEVWTKILKKVEKSILWLADTDEQAKKNLLNNFSNKGINTNRIFFAQRMDKYEEHLTRYEFVDLFLDTFPYNAHTTACDALYMGVPVLTVYGKTFTSRVGLSLLKNLEMEDFITKNLIDYENKAVYFASNKEILNNLKEKLKINSKTKSLFNSQLFVKNLENIYKKITH